MSAGNDNILLPRHLTSVIATAVLAEVRDRGWSIRLDRGAPVITAPLASLSPVLVDRLVQFDDGVAYVLHLEQECCR